jgi:P27 family predicted phage terminase small subunit
MGRQPKPTTIAWLSGDPGKRRRYKEEPIVPAAEPVCPEWLDDLAKEEWSHAVSVLRDMGLLTKADQSSLIAYVESWSEYRHACKELETNGSFFTSTSGYPMPSPWVAIKRAAKKEVLSWSDRFGMSPAARVKLAIEAKSQTDASNKWKMVS